MFFMSHYKRRRVNRSPRDKDQVHLTPLGEEAELRPFLSWFHTLPCALCRNLQEQKCCFSSLMRD